MYKNKSNKYYKTNFFYLACFLVTHDMELIDIKKSPNSRRADFIFLNSPKMESLVESFNFGRKDDPNIFVDVRKFTSATKQVKERLYQM